MKRLSSKKEWRLLYAIGITLLLAMMVGCNLFNSSTTTGSTANVFAVDNKNGKVYEIDTDANPPSAAKTALVSTSKNATGEMVIHGSKAFLAVGNDGKGNSPGLYWFDLSSSSPSAELVGTSISAQYICIVSDTVGYVSSSDYMGSYSNTVYRFDPSDPSAGLGSAVTGFDPVFYPQDIAYVDDGSGSGRVFVTNDANVLSHNSTDDKVYQLTTDGTAVDHSFSMNAGGTTGLLAGSYTAEKGVFVAKTGGYDANYNSLSGGSIDFIPLDATSSSDIITVQTDLPVGRLAAFSTNELIATNYSHTYLIDLTKASGETGQVTELKNSSNASFGSYDVNIYDGYAYVPDGANTLYKISSSGDVTAIAVGVSGDLISNVAVRE